MRSKSSSIAATILLGTLLVAGGVTANPTGVPVPEAPPLSCTTSNFTVQLAQGFPAPAACNEGPCTEYRYNLSSPTLQNIDHAVFSVSSAQDLSYTDPASFVTPPGPGDSATGFLAGARHEYPIRFNSNTTKSETAKIFIIGPSKPRVGTILIRSGSKIVESCLIATPGTALDTFQPIYQSQTVVVAGGKCTATLVFDASGNGTATGPGDAAIDATLEAVTSTPLTLRVVDHATLQSLTIYMDGADRAIAAGAQAVFHAVGFYDVGFDRSVSDTVTWHSSDEAVGGFDAAGVFTGRSAGTVKVWAELDGVRSQDLPLEVFATSELAYCDPDHVNRGVWADDFNRVTLESDCATYTAPDIVELRFSVTETQRPGGIFDPCLDLYAYQGDRLVRTIREEGCGDPFLAPAAPERDEAAVRYQLKAFWDLKGSDGTTVPAGEYEIRGRFYLYYDPVVSIRVTVQ
jgi:hypothetical protein